MLLANLTFWERNKSRSLGIYSVMDQMPNRYGEKEAGRVKTVKRGSRETALMSDQDDFFRVIREKFPRIREPSLGRYNKAKTTLHLKENVKPVFKPRRPVPYAALGSVEAELNRLEE